MKLSITIPLVVTSAFFGLAALALTGCAQLDRLYNRQVSTIPGEAIETNTTYRTNIVVTEAASTNEDGVVTPAKMAPVITPEVVVQYAPPTYVTNLVPR